MRARNIIIIFVVNYLLMLVVSAVWELSVINTRAKELQTFMSTSADMALQQTQMVDDILAKTSDNNTQSIMMPKANGQGFDKISTLDGLFGIRADSDLTRETAFHELYDNEGLSNIATRTGTIRTPVRYTDEKTGITNWYYIPKIAMMGTEVLKSSNATTRVKNAQGEYVSKELSNKILSDYGLVDSERESGDSTYFISPLNIGITYLNEDLLARLFTNNMDLLMRVKYQGKNLKSAEGGYGVLKGQTYKNRVKDSLIGSNPINNGTFTYLRGNKVSTNPLVEAFEGVKPQVVYKVIDMYDSRNDAVLSRLFGADKHGFSSKAAYLKDLDKEVINPVNNKPFPQKPIVVAKVTFYADVVVPYYTLIMRELRSAMGVSSNNMLDITDGKGKGVAGSKRVSYTKFFAVTP